MVAIVWARVAHRRVCGVLSREQDIVGDAGNTKVASVYVVLYLHLDQSTHTNLHANRSLQAPNWLQLDVDEWGRRWRKRQSNAVYNSNLFCNHDTFYLWIWWHSCDQEGQSGDLGSPPTTICRPTFLFIDYLKNAELHDEWWHPTVGVFELTGRGRWEFDCQSWTLPSKRSQNSKQRHSQVERLHIQIFPVESTILSSWQWKFCWPFIQFISTSCQKKLIARVLRIIWRILHGSWVRF